MSELDEDYETLLGKLVKHALDDKTPFKERMEIAKLVQDRRYKEAKTVAARKGSRFTRPT